MNVSIQTMAHAPGRVADTVAMLASIFKLRIGVAIMLCAVAGAAVTPGSGADGFGVLAVALAVLVSSAAAGAFNQLAERDLDARMKRTRGRPFVTGRCRASPAWLAGIVVLLGFAVAGAALFTNMIAALHVLLGALIYGVVYTLWLKRRSTMNIVVGGLAGSFAVLAGAAAVDPVPGPAAAVLAVVLFLWTPPHFWSLAFAFRDDYRRAGVPMLPCVVGAGRAARIVLAHTVALVALAFVPVAFGMSWIYLAGAVLGGVLFLRGSVRFVMQPDRKRAMANFHASLAQLTLLLVAAIADAWLL